MKAIFTINKTTFQCEFENVKDLTDFILNLTQHNERDLTFIKLKDEQRYYPTQTLDSIDKIVTDSRHPVEGLIERTLRRLEETPKEIKFELGDIPEQNLPYRITCEKEFDNKYHGN